MFTEVVVVEFPPPLYLPLYCCGASKQRNWWTDYAELRDTFPPHETRGEGASVPVWQSTTRELGIDWGSIDLWPLQTCTCLTDSVSTNDSVPSQPVSWARGCACGTACCTVRSQVRCHLLCLTERASMMFNKKVYTEFCSLSARTRASMPLHSTVR